MAHIKHKSEIILKLKYIYVCVYLCMSPSNTGSMLQYNYAI